MEKRGEYQFCPRCGTLNKENVCQCCGYVIVESEVANPKGDLPADETEMLTNTDLSEDVSETVVGDDTAPDEVELFITSGATYYDPDSPYDWDTGMLKSAMPKPEAEAEKHYYDGDSMDTYGGQFPVGYDNQDKIQKNGLAIAVISVLILFIVVLFLYICRGIYGLTENWEETSSKISSFFADSKEEANRFWDSEDGEASQDNNGNNDNYNLYDGINWEDESWKDAHPNHEISEFKGPYYEGVTDCIDTTVSYKINREFFEYDDKALNVCIRIAYYQLEGDIPNLDKINEYIKAEALYYATMYDNEKEGFDAYIKEYNGGYIVTSDAFVTYNSEELISIVLDESYSFVGNTYLGLRGININLETGTLLDNTSLLCMDEKFAAEFKERSQKQNGTIEVGVDNYSNEKLVELLNDSDHLILFYTPLGMEVGYWYRESVGVGWVTVTYRDYQNYYNSL